MIRPRSAIVGVGATPYYKRGRSVPQTLDELVCRAILAALDDAGLTVRDVDGFAYFSGGFDTPLIMETLGIPEITFTASLTGAGGGSAGMIGLAEAAIVAGQAHTVVCVGGVLLRWCLLRGRLSDLLRRLDPGVHGCGLLEGRGPVPHQ